MDLHLDRKPIDQQPRPGWHRMPDERLAFCFVQGESFALQFFPRGGIKTDEKLREAQETATRIARVCFAELGWPGPSQYAPRPPAPTTPPTPPPLRTPTPDLVEEYFKEFLNPP